MLLNQLTGQSYPIHWQSSASEANSPTAVPVRHWRLPGTVHLSPSLEDGDWNIDQAQIELPQPGQPLGQGLLLGDLVLALDLGLPYVTAQDKALEPQFNWYFRPVRPQQRLSAPPSLALGTILRGLTELLASLTSSASAQSSVWNCCAMGLEPDRVHHILANLEGVVVNSPSHCSEAYRFNLREAILAAGLAMRPEQIAFLDLPIAALLAEFHPHHRPRFEHSQWQGATLVIHTTETTTELAVVCLPSSLHNLSREDIRLRNLAYGDRAYRQDIACQLLYPYIPEGQIDLDLAILPLPGEADPVVRSQLHRALCQAPAGAMLLEAATQLNRVLQGQEHLTFEFGPYRCRFSQTALDTKVTQPFLLRLNREVNHLFSEAGLVGETIAQVICTGEGATRPAILQWLGQKLPQARIVGDSPGPAATLAAAPGTDAATGETALGDASASLHRNRPPYATHRLAYGLASLPLYSQVLDRKGQQYSSYFVLLEMLRCLPDEALTLAEILNHLEGRGINSQACQEQVELILAGHLPAGLIPQANEDQWTLASRQNLDYQVLQEPLFQQLSDQSFQVDPAQRDRLLHYWQQVTAHSQQSLEEPYSLQVGLSLSEQWV